MRRLLSSLLLLSLLPLAANAQTTSTPDDLIVKAQLALDGDRPDDALAMLQPLLAIQPPVKGLHRQLGLIYYRTSKLDEAQKAFLEAINQDASDKESVQMEGLVLYRLGQQEAAIPYLEKVREWLPKSNADATYILGLCYLNARRYDDARTAFATQFNLAPDSAGAYLILASMLKHASLHDLAVANAKKALEISPNLPMAHYLLGDIAITKANMEEAITEFLAESRLNPDYAPLYDRLGDAYLRIGKLDESQQALTKAIALDTSITGSYAKMGKLLLRRHDPKTAIMYLKHAEKMNPDDFNTHSLLAQAYHLIGKDDDAKRENALGTKLHSDKIQSNEQGK